MKGIRFPGRILTQLDSHAKSRTITPMSYTKLFSSIITSTIWSEDDATRIVWITLLACTDRNGEVQGSIPGIARLAGVSVEACRSAFDRFLSPDPDSRTKDDEGRRVEVIDGGWMLINHRKYREMASDADRAEKAAIRQRRKRERDRRNSVTQESRPRHAPVTPESHQIPQAEAESRSKEQKHRGIPEVSNAARSHPAKAGGGGNYRADQAAEIYAAYPIKKGKRPALRAIMRALREGTPPGTILESVKAFAKTSDPKPHASTYFHQRRWEDEDNGKNYDPGLLPSSRGKPAVPVYKPKPQTPCTLPPDYADIEARRRAKEASKL